MLIFLNVKNDHPPVKSKTAEIKLRFENYLRFSKKEQHMNLSFISLFPYYWKTLKLQSLWQYYFHYFSKVIRRVSVSPPASRR